MGISVTSGAFTTALSGVPLCFSVCIIFSTEKSNVNFWVVFFYKMGLLIVCNLFFLFAILSTFSRWVVCFLALSWSLLFFMVTQMSIFWRKKYSVFREYRNDFYVRLFWPLQDLKETLATFPWCFKDVTVANGRKWKLLILNWNLRLYKFEQVCTRMKMEFCILCFEAPGP